MNPPLPRAIDLVETSVNDALKHQKDLLNLNLVAFVFPVLSGLGLFGMSFLASMLSVEKTSAGFIVLFLLVMLVMLLGSVWYGAHYTLRVLKLVKGDHSTVSLQDSRGHLSSYLWITLLQFGALIVVPLISGIISGLLGLGAILNGALGSLMGGPSGTGASGLSAGIGIVLFLLMVASLTSIVYLSVRLHFSGLSYLQDNHKGTAALKHSLALSKGRFWSITWRALVFFLIYMVVSIILGVILSMFGSGMIGGMIVLIVRSAFVAFLVLPAALFFQVRLYQAYKDLQAKV